MMSFKSQTLSHHTTKPTHACWFWYVRKVWDLIHTESVPDQDIFVRLSAPKLSLIGFKSPNSAPHCLLSLFTSFSAGRLGQEPWTVKPCLADPLLPSVSIRRVSCASKSDKSDRGTEMIVTVICNIIPISEQSQIRKTALGSKLNF